MNPDPVQIDTSTIMKMSEETKYYSTIYYSQPSLPENSGSQSDSQSITINIVLYVCQHNLNAQYYRDNEHDTYCNTK